MAREALRDFSAHHDDRWLFVVVYITLAVVLSIALSAELQPFPQR